MFGPCQLEPCFACEARAADMACLGWAPEASGSQQYRACLLGRGSMITLPTIDLEGENGAPMMGGLQSHQKRRHQGGLGLAGMVQLRLVLAAAAVVLGVALYGIRHNVASIQRSRPEGVGFAMSHTKGVGSTCGPLTGV